MKTPRPLKVSVSVLIVMALSIAIISGRLTATEGTEGNNALMQNIAKTVTAQPLDVPQLRNLLEPLGWGVTPEADGSITLVPGACRPTVPPAIHAKMTQQVMTLIKEKGYECMNCHQTDTRLRGPSFKEVAAKRRCHKWAVELLTYKLSRESSGPYESSHHMQLVKEEDTPIMVDWILSY
jgi:cytochrome c551/c552